MRAKVRLFVEIDLAAGTEVSLGGDRAHYLAHVMRLGPGDPLRLFNGRCGEWLARVRAAGRGEARLTVETMLRPPTAEPGPVLLFAPLKKDALDFLVEKACELGAERLRPVETRFVSVARVNIERLRAQAIEASEQCGRLTVPPVDPMRPLAEALGAWPPDRPLLFLDERGSGRPIAEVAGRPRAPDHPSPVGILVGPEGGFAAEEARAIAGTPGAVPVSLGPRILRAETAAIAALACWQALAGDCVTANEIETPACPDPASPPTSPRPTGGG